MGAAEQKVQDRLENIRGVEPILNALRTIALGNWKLALKRREWALEFSSRIGRILADIPPEYLPSPASPSPDGTPAGRNRVIALVIGSERGLCGAFNRVLAERTGRYLEYAARSGDAVRLQAAGAFAARTLERIGLEPERLRISATTSLPSFEIADGLAGDWLTAYEADEVDRVDVLYNAYLGSGRYETRVLRLLPPRIPPRPAANDFGIEYPPIIQTDPAALIARIVVQQLSVRLYACLLESAAAENSARYQMMEDARQNIERLMEELEAETIQAYRQSITLELQNLAVGSGLLQEEK